MNSIIKTPQYKKLSEKIGSFIEYWGFKKVHGQIWTLIFLSPKPIDANFIINSLKISKALVSMSVKDLLHYNVIFEVEKDRPGTQKYTINHDITQVILDIIIKREGTMLKEIQESCQSLEKIVKKNKDADVDPVRMKELSSMVEASNLLLKGMIAGENVDFDSFEKVMTIDEST